MRFVKMQSAGNDYIYADYNEIKSYNLPTLSKWLSRRRFSVGADGLIAVEKINGKTIKMYMLNSDGSFGSTCGNGVRCSALFAKKYLGLNTDEITVITKSSVAFVKLFYSKGKTFAQANMGKPTEEYTANFNEKLKEVGLYGDKQRVFLVNTGNSHLVCFTPNLSLDELCEKVIKTNLFPDGINIERVFDAQKLNDNGYLLKAEIFERGSGKTLSCGSGTCAIAYAFSKFNKMQNEEISVSVLTEGGILQANISSGTAFLAGEINECFVGEIADNLLFAKENTLGKDDRI